jgi:hypothetical protein
MKQLGLVCGLFLVLLGSAQAQERIYRCGNEYTNTVPSPLPKGCKLLDGGNLTVVQGLRPGKAASGSQAANGNTTAAQNSARVNLDEQKSRDADARLILQAELRKAEARQAELTAEYNKGEPEKRGDEARNHQKYLDRVAELKASLERNTSDLEGIRRELGRLPSASNAR